MYTIRQSAVLCWGKLRRALLIALRKERVVGTLERRQGDCLRCGACCKLFLRCPSYDDSGGTPRCRVYEDRPGACGLFPLDERDLRDRDWVLPGKKCGFSFNGHPNGNGNGNGRHEESLRKESYRWGPPKTHPDGRRKYIRGTLAILWSCFRRGDGRS